MTPTDTWVIHVSLYKIFEEVLNPLYLPGTSTLWTILSMMKTSHWIYNHYYIAVINSQIIKISLYYLSCYTLHSLNAFH